MKVLAFRESGGVDKFELVSVTDPDSHALAEDEVLVRMKAAGLNQADKLFVEERYFVKPAFHPVACESGENAALCRVGMEGAGVVVAAGDQSGFAAGDRVATIPLMVDPTRQGTIGELVVFRKDQLFAVPAGQDMMEAGSVWMMWLTAWGGLMDEGKLREGETVTITAASSSVGVAAIQLAKLAGARVIATTTSAEKVSVLYEQGADLVVDTRKENYAEQVREFTRGRGTDLVFDAVAGAFMPELIRGSARGGRIVVHGRLDARPMEVHSGVLMKRLLTLSGYTVDKLTQRRADLDSAVRTLFTHRKAGRLHPLVESIYPLTEYRQAYRHLLSGQHTGKIVVDLAG